MHGMYGEEMAYQLKIDNGVLKKQYDTNETTAAQSNSNLILVGARTEMFLTIPEDSKQSHRSSSESLLGGGTQGDDFLWGNNDFSLRNSIDSNKPSVQTS
jgi:hypothetical protein